jgi:hypothetical protein
VRGGPSFCAAARAVKCFAFGPYGPIAGPARIGNRALIGSADG